jgi:hypothetical protein
MSGEFDLAKIRSSVWGNSETQTIEYKGFGRENARKLPPAAIRGGVENAELPREFL